MELYDDAYKNGAKKLKESAQEVVDAYKNYQKILLEKSPLGTKMNELVMLASSCALRCSYCIDTHSTRAKNAGATDQEIAFIIQLAASVCHGAAVSYGVNALAE